LESSSIDLLEKFAPKKKKKTLVLTNAGKRAVGGYYISAEKGRNKKKTLVLTNVGKRAGGVLHNLRFYGFKKFRTISFGYN
jgi:hypothetical protein